MPPTSPPSHQTSDIRNQKSTPRLLITAGPTREPIDAVRFISNRSSGKLGIALARAADEAGHDVTLLLGPGPATPSLGSLGVVYRFESSAELKQLLEAHWRDHDVLVMAAAVSDYRPLTVHEGKLPRAASGTLTIELQPTPDLSALMAASKRPGQRVIAFALEEPDKLESRALEKMKRKGVDAIVANPLETMDAETISPVWLTRDGQRDAGGRMSKEEFAKWLLNKVNLL
jgi:phosphopantothenoylcysteine decarboxylase/phosphopantothenate--cysteine ligase